MSRTHVIVGAGPVGSATAQILAARGERVTIVTRRGGGPQREGIDRVAADATDAERLTKLATGAVALYNCANPQYHEWLRDWPPLHAALLTAAERAGATLVTMSNLYGCGPVGGPITAQTPLSATHPKLRLRADMWRDALALHEAGRIRATEVRGSDFIEGNGLFAVSLAKPLLAGRRAYSVAPLDVKHSWTSTADTAAALAAVATEERALGRAWIVPTAPPLTVRELAATFARACGAPAPKLTRLPYPLLWTFGVFSPTVKELRTTFYQFAREFVVDSSETTQVLGLTPRPIEESLRACAAHLRGEPAA